MNQGRQNSIKSLQNLYTVVIGVALSLSAVELVRSADSIIRIPANTVLLFLAFILTLVPFYHGALRHLDDAYIENENAHIRDGALVIDVLLLMLHGMVFLILALLLNRPEQFAWALVALIAVDICWGIWAYYGFSSQTDSSAEGTWTWINILFVVIVGGSLVFFDIGQTPTISSTKLAMFMLAACFLRTLLDYKMCWQFYFPPISVRKSEF